jgi:translation initiation factor 6 (eIF-6)
MSKALPHGNVRGQLLTGEERRRSNRVMLRIPVSLKVMVAGKAVTANANTVSVNDHGAMILCTRSFAAETAVEVYNDRTNERMNCRVTRTPIENSDGYLIPVEFLTAAPAFWRISFPPRDWKPGDE